MTPIKQVSVASINKNNHPAQELAWLLCLILLFFTAMPALAVDMLAEYRFEGDLNLVQPGSTLMAFGATDADSDPLTYKLNGGTDAAHFQIDGKTGRLTFNAPPDFHNPINADSDNQHEVTVQADDGKGGTANQDLISEMVPDGIAVSNAGALTYNASDSAMPVAPNLTITFSSTSSMDEAKVNISNGYQNGADRLGIQGQSGSSGTVEGLNWSWYASIGVLSLTGNAPAATYQTALRQVTYVNRSEG